MTIGLDSTTSTSTDPLAFLRLVIAGVTADREILRRMADLARPVPAALAPAFWQKNISSVGGYLESWLVTFHVRESQLLYIPNRRLVEQGVCLRVVEQCQRRVRTDDVQEFFVVDVEGPSKQSFLGCPGVELLGADRDLVSILFGRSRMMLAIGTHTVCPLASDGEGTVPRTLKLAWSTTWA